VKPAGDRVRIQRAIQDGRWHTFMQRTTAFPPPQYGQRPPAPISPFQPSQIPLTTYDQRSSTPISPYEQKPPVPIPPTEQGYPSLTTTQQQYTTAPQKQKSPTTLPLVSKYCNLDQLCTQSLPNTVEFKPVLHNNTFM
jgi:hypothetical protein